MKAELDKLKQQVIDGDAAKAKVQALQQVYDKKTKSKADYTAQRPGLLARWQTQRCEILHLIAQVTAGQAKWSDDVHAKVCQPLADIAKAKANLAKLQEGLVLLQASTDVVYTPVKQATDKVAAATKLNQDWMDISGALGKRLTDLETRVGALKRSATPKTDPSSLYSLFFDLLPDLLAIAPTDAAADIAELNQFNDKLKDCTRLDVKPPPQLVPVDALSDAQNQAWKDLGQAQADLKAAQDAIAAQTTALETAQTDIQAKTAALTTPPAAAAAARAA